VAAILTLGSAASSFYIADVSRNNAHALQLRDAVTKSVNHIRQASQRVDTTLSAMVVSPRQEYPQQINQSLQQAIDDIQKLRSFSLDDTPKAKAAIENLHVDALNLQKVTQQLITQMKDTNWVYPMRPYINNILLESNTEFESATALALQEIAEEEGDAYSSPLYRQIAQIRDLWRLQILNFRAIIVRFTGPSHLKRIPQEENIDLVNTEIRQKINTLEKLSQKNELGLTTEESLTVMRYRAKKWYDDFQRLQKIRYSKIWRADVHFIATKIRPLQTHIHNDLERLEKEVLDWSSKNTAAVEKAAFQANLELWGMTIVAVFFVVLVYVMISRGVLTPIKLIADAISEDGKQVEHIPLPNKGSHEIHTLITAYNTMRRQIHHRQIALEHQAMHDSLTGLPNRALLQDRLEQAIQQARRHNSNIAFMLLDLDRFKNINDTLGHAVGDQVLQEISQRLSNSLRTSDTVARLGGDEFAIISPEVDDIQISALIEKITSAIGRPIEINKQNMHVDVSIGISLFPKNDNNADSLMRLADIAMYDAKRNKKGHSFFHKKMEELNTDSLSLLGELKEELKNPTENLSLHYQPQIDLQTNKIHNVEALLRWRHPQNGVLPPDEIVHMCEQSGLITELTLWVMERAIRECAGWEKDGLDLNVAVNLSTWDLQNNELPTHVMQLLTQYKLDANKLTLEITESAVMNDPTRARETLNALSKMGIRLDIDDYGTGFSSLAYLKMLPVSGLKIDKSFVIDMQEDENDRIIVRSTIDLSHNLKLTVIAEGVETAEALAALKEHHCDYAQGHFIAAPMSAAKLKKWCQQYETSSTDSNA